MAQRMSGSLIAFTAMAFLICGLAGVFATYALPIPMERGFAVDAALDEALDAAHSADPATAIAALAPRLGESATPVAAGPGTLVERIQRERGVMRQRFLAEEAATALRLRWLCVMICLTAALFVGSMVGGLSRRLAVKAADR